MTMNTDSTFKRQVKVELITQSRKNITCGIIYKIEMMQLPPPLGRNIHLKSYITDPILHLRTTNISTVNSMYHH